MYNSQKEKAFYNSTHDHEDVTEITYEATDDAVRAADGQGQVDGGDLPEGGGQQRGERPQHQRLLLEQARLRHVPEIFNFDYIETILYNLSLLAPTGAQEMQLLVCSFVRLSEAKCSTAHNLNPLGSDYIKMTSG